MNYTLSIVSIFKYFATTKVVVASSDNGRQWDCRVRDDLPGLVSRQDCPHPLQDSHRFSQSVHFSRVKKANPCIQRCLESSLYLSDTVVLAVVPKQLVTPCLKEVGFACCSVNY